MRLRRYLVPLVLVMSSALAVGCTSQSAQSTENEQPAAPNEGDKKEGNMQADDEQAVEEQLSAEPAEAAPDDFAGSVEREPILEAKERWSLAFEKTGVDEDAAMSLAEVEPGARIEVYLGVWCGDSLREVTRFWKALDAAGEVPFEVNYIGVDRQFEAGDVSLEGVDLEAVPTFVVYRDDTEVGRVVENSPNTIEEDLHALLTGEKSGKLSETR